MNEIIKHRLMDRFKDIYVDVVGHDSDGFEFDVRCFGIEEASYEAITNAVYDLEDELFPCGTISLSAIVFTVEETETYYPEMALHLQRVKEVVEAVSNYPLSGQADLLRRFKAPAKRVCYIPRGIGDFSSVAAYVLEKKYAPAPEAPEAQAADESYAIAA